MPDPLERAAAANDLMWTASHDRGAYRALRASAVTAAIGAGHTAEEVSARLGVKPADVDWIVNADSHDWTSRHRPSS